MAISKGHRFPIDFAEAFPQGLVLVGEVAPDTEYQSREDRAAGRPVSTTQEALPGMRAVELDGLTAEPRVAGNGEFKYQSYLFRASGFRAASAGGRTQKSTESTSKAA
ncbi:hypothetical protein [Labedaea rhizosphaerae]|uniref:Uncharacterized protein n=1 Tax=Labedaea rhizosphaerae TaxID=598644 RepID=A0A4R6S8K4_LABRH|nr:hypothetical protein [Labedaea rhizosphaerae]TDP96222.1 hypothetical protein EV186_104204 [Labedaea rhizosphaerae]